MNVQKIVLIVKLLIIVYAFISLHYLTMNPLRWNTPVKVGEKWVYQDSKKNPFENPKIDTIWVVEIRGNYVKVEVKPWYSVRKIEQVYQKTDFCQSRYKKIK